MLHPDRNRRSPALVAVPLLVLALSGCSAEAGSFDEPTASTESKIIIGPDGKALQYFYCAPENSNCLLGSTVQYVAYGAEGRWAFLDKSGSFACNNATFGRDPWEHHAKDCYYAPYTPVANEGGSMDTPGEYAFGADGWFAFLTFQPAAAGTRLPCSSDFFGEPLPDDRPEKCYAANPGFTRRAGENETFHSSVLTPVAFGANGIYRYANLLGDNPCVKATFGNVNPTPGVVKTCTGLETVGWVDEGSTFSRQGSTRVLYGSGLNARYLSSTALSGSCTNAFFGGDPAPGTPKHCFYMAF